MDLCDIADACRSSQVVEQRAIGFEQLEHVHCPSAALVWRGRGHSARATSTAGLPAEEPARLLARALPCVLYDRFVPQPGVDVMLAPDCEKLGRGVPAHRL